MPTERLSMRKIRDVLRLRFESGLSERVSRALVVAQRWLRELLPPARPPWRACALALAPTSSTTGRWSAFCSRRLRPRRRRALRVEPDWHQQGNAARRGQAWHCCGRSIAHASGRVLATAGYGTFKSRLCDRRCGKAMPAPARSIRRLCRDNNQHHQPLEAGGVRPDEMKLFVAAMGASSLLSRAGAAGAEQNRRLDVFRTWAAPIISIRQSQSRPSPTSTITSGLNRSYSEFADRYGVAILPAHP